MLIPKLRQLNRYVVSHPVTSVLLLLVVLAFWQIHSQQLHHRAYHWSRLHSSISVQEQADAVWLFDYVPEIQAKPLAGIAANLSGLSWDPERNRLWAVTNSPTVLIALDRDGEVERQIELTGFHDVEAVTYVGGGILAVAEERRNTIVFIRVPPLGIDVIDRTGATAWRLGPDYEENDGIEGLTYDSVEDRLLVVKERDPQRFYAFGDVMAALAQGVAPSQHSLMHWLDGDVFARDLSSVSVDPDSGHVLLLSDESRLVLELSATGDLVSFKSLRQTRGGLSASVPQAEGMAVGPGGTLFITSEPNLFYRFSAKPDPD